MPRAPQRDACPRCSQPLRYLACRTVHTGAKTYVVHVRLCARCNCAYGDTDGGTQPKAEAPSVPLE
jgi:hypothetical protein